MFMITIVNNGKKLFFIRALHSRMAFAFGYARK